MGVNGAICLEIRSAIPSAEDYDEPKTAFLLVVKRLAFEGYSYSSIKRGMGEAFFDAFGRGANGSEWRSLFEALGDVSVIVDDDQYYKYLEEGRYGD